MNSIRTFVLFYFVLFFETGFHCVAQAGLELEILLSQPPKCLGLLTNLACFKANGIDFKLNRLHLEIEFDFSFANLLLTSII
jgi:hypothetical protein